MTTLKKKKVLSTKDLPVAGIKGTNDLAIKLLYIKFSFKDCTGFVILFFYFGVPFGKCLKHN